MKRRNPAKIADATVRYLLLAAGTVVFTLPMIYMISTSLRPNGALYEYPPRFFPKWEALTLENYDYILHQSKFYLNFLNSVVVSLSTVALAAAVSSAMAFVLGKFKSRATQLLFGFIIVTMIIPGTTMIVPQFELATGLGLVNRLWGLIPFYVAWVIPFSTFMIKGFMENIPGEIMDAAWIDGANVLQTYGRIALPLASPAIASVSIFNFLTAWEEYPWANTVINDNSLRTLPIAIAGFFGQHQFTQWGYVFAMSRADADSGDCDLHLLPAVLCAGSDRRQREGMSAAAAASSKRRILFDERKRVRQREAYKRLYFWFSQE